MNEGLLPQLPDVALGPLQRPEDTRLERVFETELERVDGVSFDLFDTLVHRPGLFAPKDLFYLVRDRAQEALNRELPDFVEHRIQGERNARVRAWGRGSQEVRLVDIYQELGRRLGLDSERVDRILQLELDTERSVLRTHPIGRRLFERAAARGRKVVVLSDTYFEPEFLAEILGTAGYPADGPVFASSGRGKTKDDGALFSVVIQELATPPSRWLHVGDNVHSDFRMALGQGIRAFVLPSDPGRLRSLHGVGDIPSGSPFASAVLNRVSECYFEEEDEERGVDRRIAARLALLYLSFATWLTQKVVESSPRTIYFASRDGCIMKRFFELVAEARGIEIDTRYLYVSRMGLYPTLVFSDRDAARQVLSRSWDGITVSEALERASLEPAKCRALLERYGFSGPDRLEEGEPTTRFERLLDQAWPEVAHKNRKHFERALRYLEQEGLLRRETAAFVDIGWHGSLQNSIVKLIEHLGIDKEIHGYYLATFEKPAGATQAFRSEGYLLENDRPAWRAQLVRSSPSLLELLHGADHGSVIGYETTKRGVVPILDANPDDERQHREIIAPLQEEAWRIASAFLDAWRGRPIEPIPAPLVARIALSMIAHPDSLEARRLARLKHAADFGGQRRSIGGRGGAAGPLWPAGQRVLEDWQRAHREPRNDGV